MIDSQMLDALDQLCRAARRKGGPFGSRQVVVFGDFSQLPPTKPFKYCTDCGGYELPHWEDAHNSGN
jgi:hypothetical protein